MRKLTVLALAGVLSATVLPTAQSASEIPSVPLTFEAFEVANPNAEQQGEVEQLRQTLASRGMPTDGIRVYAVPEADGPTTYVTRSPWRFRIRAVGEGVYQAVPRTDPAPPGLAELPGTVQPMSAGGWALEERDCFRMSLKWFARWVCWQLDKQQHDNDPARSYWQYKQESTGNAKRGWEMKRLWVEGKPAGDTVPMRFDGIPEPKDSIPKQDRCKTETRSVSIQIGSGTPVSLGSAHSWDKTTCEEYEIKHYDDHGHWANIWKGEPVKPDQSRNVVFVMPVSSNEGARPTWEPWSGQHRD
jgi:hypothetical protein